ncbi:MAG TPA: MSMEG_6728 family protein [Fimbriimonas sp.]|nr:MSMEG_6728 family protein [Fimbriimonas sp.]
MQTFLPYPDFAESARVLDNKRLGKQRVEVLQILNVLTDSTRKGWRNHPAVAMWRGHEGALIEYGVAICNEWIGRGFRDTVRLKLLDRQIPPSPLPAWLGDECFHSSHRSILLQKNPDHYAQFGWDDPIQECHWPV